jgi:hypothetical protein
MPLRASLIIEAIGGRAFPRRLFPGQPWVAEVVGTDPRYGLRRRFLRAKVDYYHANSVGTRGVMLCYLLDPGPIYEIYRKTSWTNAERFFARVEDGRIVRVTRGEVMACLSASEVSAAMS